MIFILVHLTRAISSPWSSTKIFIITSISKISPFISIRKTSSKCSLIPPLQVVLSILQDHYQVFLNLASPNCGLLSGTPPNRYFFPSLSRLKKYSRDLSHQVFISKSLQAQKILQGLLPIIILFQAPLGSTSILGNSPNKDLQDFSFHQIAFDFTRLHTSKVFTRYS